MIRTILISIVISMFPSFVVAQNAQKPPLPELWANLQTPIDTEKAKRGDAIIAVANDSWVYLTCGISVHAELNGKVVTVAKDQASGGTKLSLRFDAPCENKTRAPLVLIAVYHPVDPKGQMDMYMSMPQGIGAGASGRRSTKLDQLPSPDQPPEQQPIAKLGEVKGIRHLSLAVGMGELGSTVLATPDRRLKLQTGTRLAFVPVPLAD